MKNATSISLSLSAVLCVVFIVGYVEYVRRSMANEAKIALAKKESDSTASELGSCQLMIASDIEMYLLAKNPSLFTGIAIDPIQPPDPPDYVGNGEFSDLEKRQYELQKRQYDLQKKQEEAQKQLDDQRSRDQVSSSKQRIAMDVKAAISAFTKAENMRRAYEEMIGEQEPPLLQSDIDKFRDSLFSQNPHLSEVIAK